MPTVLITGTGLIANHLSEKLLKKGYQVTFLSRSKDPDSKQKVYIWDVKNKTIEKEAIATADYIVHLAGTNIGAKRWTDERKKSIIDSRVDSAALLFSEVKKQKKVLDAFITASGVGYYGAITSEKIFTENDPPATDFLGETCKKWEAAADVFHELNIRTVKIRTAVVLAKNDSALDRMLTPIKLGIGSPLGTGEQYMPWIHIDDICEIYLKAIEDANMNGAFNAAAPDQKNNSVFMKTIAKVLDKPFFFPKIPSFMLKIVLGEMAVVVLEGSRVSDKKIRKTGFEFQFAELEAALQNLL